MTRGGKRAGAGRPKKTYKTEIYSKTIKPEWRKILDMLISQLRKGSPIVKKVKNDLGFDFDVV